MGTLTQFVFKITLGLQRNYALLSTLHPTTNYYIYTMLVMLIWVRIHVNQQTHNGNTVPP